MRVCFTFFIFEWIGVSQSRGGDENAAKKLEKVFVEYQLSFPLVG